MGILDTADVVQGADIPATLTAQQTDCHRLPVVFESFQGSLFGLTFPLTLLLKVNDLRQIDNRQAP